MSEKILLEIENTKQHFKDIANLIENGKKFGNDEKQTLFLAYYDLDVEHLHSLLLLIDKNLIGSALALIRTYYETFYRALWMYAFSTPQEVEDIRNNTFNFMPMSPKIDQLDSFYTGEDFFSNMKVGSWNNMCDYTHSGTCQLSRRWTEEELKPNYSENEILEVLIEIRKIFLLFSYTLFKIHNYTEEENSILNMIETDNEQSKVIIDEIYKES